RQACDASGLCAPAALFPTQRPRRSGARRADDARRRGCGGNGSMTREPIYAALFALVAGAASFVTISRRLRHWSDVGAAEQPALFMIQKSENAEERAPLPVKWR